MSEKTPNPDSGKNELKKLAAYSAAALPRHEKNENRVVILVEVSQIDSLLNQLLEVSLAPSGDQRDELLSEGQPLGSFVLRAKLAKRMGLISHDFYGGLSDLAKIRNLCAHSDDDFKIFDDDSVKDRINNVWARLAPEFQKHGDSPLPTKPKDRFRVVSVMFRAQLIVATNNIKAGASAPTEAIFTQGYLQATKDNSQNS